MVLSQDLKWKDCSRYLRGSTALIHQQRKPAWKLEANTIRWDFSLNPLCSLFTESRVCNGLFVMAKKKKKNKPPRKTVEKDESSSSSGEESDEDAGKSGRVGSKRKSKDSGGPVAKRRSAEGTNSERRPRPSGQKNRWRERMDVESMGEEEEEAEELTEAELAALAGQRRASESQAMEEYVVEARSVGVVSSVSDNAVVMDSATRDCWRLKKFINSDEEMKAGGRVMKWFCRKMGVVGTKEQRARWWKLYNKDIKNKFGSYRSGASNGIKRRIEGK